MVAPRHTPRDREPAASNAYGGSAYHAQGSGTTTATNAYGGSATHYAGYGTVATNSSGQTASAYHPPATYYGYHPPATAAYYGTTCYNCTSGSTAGAAAAGAIVGVAVGAAAASSKASSESTSAYNAGYSAGAANASTANANAAAANANAAAAHANAAAERQCRRCQCECCCGPPTSRIRWAQFMGRYLPAASVPKSREVEPIICAATPGSVRPMVRTVYFIAWCPHRKGKVHRSNGTAFMWKKIEKTEEIS